MRLFFCLIVFVIISKTNTRGQVFEDFCAIQVERDTVEHGQKYQATFTLKPKHLNDSSKFEIQYNGKPLPLFKNGRTYAEFIAFHFDPNHNDEVRLLAFELTLKYTDSNYPITLNYWTRPNPAYTRSLAKSKPTIDFELFPDSKPFIKNKNLKNLIIKKFNLSNSTGHLAITFIIDKEGELSSLDIVKNTFNQLSFDNLNDFLTDLRFEPGILNSEKVNTLDYLIIQLNSR